MNSTTRLVTILSCAALTAASARAQTGRVAALTAGRLELDLDRAVAPAPGEPGEDRDAPAEDGDPQGYGLAGSDWLSVGTGVANNFHDATDFNLHLSYTTFLADRLEFGVEVGGWYFNQREDDTGGVSGGLVLRWHLLAAEDHRWTVFADAGIGVLGGLGEVPDGGTHVNFMPRAGFGYSRAIDDPVDGESRGPRWLVGVRWHHISNARINGDAENPARDGLMAYFELVFPF